MNEQNNIPQPPYYSVESIAQRRAEKKRRNSPLQSPYSESYSGTIRASKEQEPDGQHDASTSMPVSLLTMA